MSDIRLGILGGTFDPPHYAHLVLAENALAQLGLDRVLFAIAGHPPHKPNHPIATDEQRVRMVEAAMGDAPHFGISFVDLERPGPHYTVDMLALLKEQHPGATLHFLIGGDSLAHLPSWREPERIVAQARLGVMERPGYTPDLDALAREIPSIRERVDWLEVPNLEISSAELRRRVRESLPIRYLVPPAVERYIRESHLYQSTPHPR